MNPEESKIVEDQILQKDESGPSFLIEQEMLALIQEDNTLHATDFKDHKFEFNLHQINEANRLIQQEANNSPE